MRPPAIEEMRQSGKNTPPAMLRPRTPRQATPTRRNLEVRSSSPFTPLRRFRPRSACALHRTSTDVRITEQSPSVGLLDRYSAGRRIWEFFPPDGAAMVLPVPVSVDGTRHNGSRGQHPATGGIHEQTTR